MDTSALAHEFTALLKQHDHAGAAKKFNADNIVSYEAMEGPMAVCEGKDAVAAKGEWWYANHEVHGGTVDGPFVNGDSFIVHFTMDITVKETGERMNMSEMGLYDVDDGQIVSETFYYLQA